MTSTGNLFQARAARSEDTESILQVLCAAFGMDPEAARPLFYQDPSFDLSHKRVLATPLDGVVSCLTIIPALLHIGEAVIPTGGIAGVATHPQHQRRGYAGRLLTATVAALADEMSYPVAALFAYSEDFYRRYGWVSATRAALWSGPLAGLSPYSEASCVRLGTDQDESAIHRLYETAARSRTGAFSRDTRRWKVICGLTPGRLAVVYESPAGIIEGYAFIEICPGEPAVLLVHEMHGLTDAARRGLVGFLARQSGNDGLMEWETSPEDLSLFGFFSLSSLGRVQPQITLKPGMMLRLIDLPAALSCMYSAHYAGILAEHGGTVTVRANDPLRPRNERPVRLHHSGVHPGSHADRNWISADVTVLAQLYIGYQTPSEAAAVGLLTASSPATLLLADRLFPARRPFASPVDQF